MGLLRISRTPLVTVSPQATVMQAVRTMVQESIGAVAVTEDSVVIGMFSERDLMLRCRLRENGSRTNPDP